MEVTTQSMSPKDLFLTALTTEEQKWKLTEKNIVTGNTVIDELANLVNTYGLKSAQFYENHLNAPKSLSYILKTYTGMDFEQWCMQYTLLMAKELLIETDYTLNAIARRIGFSGGSTFSKWFIRIEKQCPSIWRLKEKQKSTQYDKNILAQTKKGMERPKQYT
ncbi:MAG: helix-turn-helix domain-containing protein [Spirochaetales bacterium]